MLFDLSGKRKRFIQVIYAILAGLFAITFVGFGIGSDAAGGIFDAFGLGSGNGSSNPQYERQIEQAEEKLETDPENRNALIELARTHALDAASEISVDPETGVLDISEDARSKLESSADAWQRYLATKPAEPDSSTSITMVKQVYIPLNDAGGAAEAQAIFAAENPSSNSFATLAQFHYFDGDIKAGDAAAERALALAEGSTKTTLNRQLNQLAKQAEEFEKAQKQAAKQGGENPIESPFGSLGGSGVAP